MDAQEFYVFRGDLKSPVQQLSAPQSPLEYVKGGFVRASTLGAWLRNRPTKYVSIYVCGLTFARVNFSLGMAMRRMVVAVLRNGWMWLLCNSSKN